MNDIILKDRRTDVLEIGNIVRISDGSVGYILHDDLHTKETLRKIGGANQKRTLSHQYLALTCDSFTTTHQNRNKHGMNQYDLPRLISFQCAIHSLASLDFAYDL